MEKKLFNLTMKNIQTIGKKHYAEIPTELLFADESFQRTDTCSKEKIRRLANKFDINKMDTLRVVPHAETCNFSIIDGYHRFKAAEMLGIDSVPCEVIVDAP